MIFKRSKSLNKKALNVLLVISLVFTQLIGMSLQFASADQPVSATGSIAPTTAQVNTATDFTLTLTPDYGSFGQIEFIRLRGVSTSVNTGWSQPSGVGSVVSVGASTTVAVSSVTSLDDQTVRLNLASPIKYDSAEKSPIKVTYKSTAPPVAGNVAALQAWVSETSGASGVSVTGIQNVTVTQKVAKNLVFKSAIESPANPNYLDMDVEVQDEDGTAQSVHDLVTGAVKISTGSINAPDVSASPATISIPNGTSKTTVRLSTTKVGTVGVSVDPGSPAGLTAVPGVATFRAGSASKLVMFVGGNPAPDGKTSVNPGDPTATIQFRVTDANGNEVDLDALGAPYTANLLSSPSTVGSVPATTTIGTNGDSADITATRATNGVGELAVSVTLNYYGTNYTGSGKVIFLGDADDIKLSVDTNNIVADGTTKAKITAEVVDKMGNIVTGQTGDVDLALSTNDYGILLDGSPAISSGKAEDDFTSTTLAGTTIISASLSANPTIKNKTVFSVTTVNKSAARFKVTSHTASTTAGEGYSVFEVKVVKGAEPGTAENREVVVAADVVDVASVTEGQVVDPEASSSPTSGFADFPAKTNNKGSLYIRFQYTKAETATFKVTDPGAEVAEGRASATFVAGSASNVDIVASPEVVTADGTDASNIELQLYDKYGNIAREVKTVAVATNFGILDAPSPLLTGTTSGKATGATLKSSYAGPATLTAQEISGLTKGRDTDYDGVIDTAGTDAVTFVDTAIEVTSDPVSGIAPAGYDSEITLSIKVKNAGVDQDLTAIDPPVAIGATADSDDVIAGGTNNTRVGAAASVLSDDGKTRTVKIKTNVSPAAVWATTFKAVVGGATTPRETLNLEFKKTQVVTVTPKYIKGSRGKAVTISGTGFMPASMFDTSVGGDFQLGGLDLVNIWVLGGALIPGGEVVVGSDGKLGPVTLYLNGSLPQGKANLILDGVSYSGVTTVDSSAPTASSVNVKTAVRAGRTLGTSLRVTDTYSSKITVTQTIRNSKGKIVSRIAKTVSKGALVSFAATLKIRGKYSVVYTLKDLAGNVRNTAKKYVTVK